jgi:hypothetical protein
MVGEFWRALEAFGQRWRPLDTWDRFGDLWTGFENPGQDLDNARQACRPLDRIWTTLGRIADFWRPLDSVWTKLDGPADICSGIGQLWAWLENYGELWRHLDMVGDLWTPLDRVGDLWIPCDRFGDLSTGFETYGQDLENARQA